MGVDWYRQPRDNITGKWYSDNPRWWDCHLRLNTDERDELEEIADELGISMTDALMHGLKLLRRQVEADRKPVKDAALSGNQAAPPVGGPDP